MFQSDSGLFLLASMSVLNAQKYYKQACEKIDALQNNYKYSFVPSYRFSNVIGALQRCRFSNLLDEIEKTKTNLMALDQAFAIEYITLLNNSVTIDNLSYESMTELEKSFYVFAVREYDFLLLEMLEKADAEGNLTDEMKVELQNQRIKVINYKMEEILEFDGFQTSRKQSAINECFELINELEDETLKETFTQMLNSIEEQIEVVNFNKILNNFISSIGFEYNEEKAKQVLNAYNKLTDEEKAKVIDPTEIIEGWEAACYLYQDLMAMHEKYSKDSNYEMIKKDINHLRYTYCMRDGKYSLNDFSLKMLSNNSQAIAYFNYPRNVYGGKFYDSRDVKTDSIKVLFEKNGQTPDMLELLNGYMALDAYMYDMEILNEAYDNRGYYFIWNFTAGAEYKKTNNEELIKNIEKRWGLEHIPTDWQLFKENPFSFIGSCAVSTVCGLLNVVEGVIDASVLTTGGLVGYLGGIFNSDFKDSIFNISESIIEADITGAMYEGTMGTLLGVDEKIYNSSFAQSCGSVGNFIGYAVLYAIAPEIAPYISATSLSGQSGERTFINGGSYEDALVVSGITWGSAYLTGAKLNNTTSYGLGIGGAVSETLAVCGTEYLTYAKDMTDASGNKMYNSFFDYYSDSGASFETVLAALFAYAEVAGNRNKAAVDVDIKNSNKTDMDGHNGSFVDPKAAQFNEANDAVVDIYLNGEHTSGIDIVGAEAMGNYQKYLDDQKADWNADLKAMTPEQRSKYWEDYFSSQYGADNVERSIISRLEEAGASYKNIASACEKHGITVEQFVINSQRCDLSMSELEINWAVNKELYGELLDTDGYIKQGTPMSKIISLDDWNTSPYYMTGKSLEIGNCQGLTRDYVGKNSHELIDYAGLNYKNNQYVGKNGVRVDEVIVIEYLAPDSTIHPRASAAFDVSGGQKFDYTKIDGKDAGFSSSPLSDAEYDIITTDPAYLQELSRITGVDVSRIECDHADWYNNVLNPDTTTGITMNQGSDIIGIPEFSSVRTKTPNAEIWKVDSNGNRTKVGYSDISGNIIRI